MTEPDDPDARLMRGIFIFIVCVWLVAGLLQCSASAADTVDPQVLSIEWPDGVEIVAATNAGICAIAVSALLSGLWRPLGRPEPPLSASCATGNAFAADAFCVKGHGRDCGRR